MNHNLDIKMSRKEARDWREVQHKTNVREAYKRTKNTHNFLCTCRRCEPSIITKWKKIDVKEMA